MHRLKKKLQEKEELKKYSTKPRYNENLLGGGGQRWGLWHKQKQQEKQGNKMNTQSGNDEETHF